MTEKAWVLEPEPLSACQEESSGFLGCGTEAEGAPASEDLERIGSAYHKESLQ